MPQTNEGVLLVVGAIFFLIGLLGGGVELAAIRIPSIGKYPRFLASGVGVIFMGLAVGRLIFPSLPPQSLVTPARIETPTPVSTLVAAAPTETPVLPTATPSVSPNTPQSSPPTPTNTPPPTPTPTATIDADPMVYDNFNNPANNGSYDKSRWTLRDLNPVCDVAQRDGAMVFKNTPPLESVECTLYIPEQVAATNLKVLEFRAKISPDFTGDSETVNIGIDNGTWWSQCSLRADSNGVIAALVNSEGENRDYDAAYDRWYLLRYEIDPDSFRQSCFVDNQLIKSFIPKNAAELKNKKFNLWVHTWIRPNSSATILVDDVRITPW